MLPASARLRTAADFRRVTRSGRRAGRSTLVIHAAPREGGESRAGFVVSKAVGGAVIRNRTKRRLRHLVGDALPALTAPIDVVVRALPGAASQPERLQADFGSAWAAVTR